MNAVNDNEFCLSAIDMQILHAVLSKITLAKCILEFPFAAL